MLMLIGVGGLVLAYAGKKLLARQEIVEGPQVDLIPVAVADLPAGTVITQSHIGQARIRIDRIMPESARTEKVLLGRVVKNPLKRAEPINMVDLYPPGEFPPLDVAPGMRAVSVDLGDSASVSSLKTGQYVDVHFTPTSIVDPEKGPFTMTLFKGVKVLALGNPGSTTRGNGGVTLELTPEQSNIVILAKDKGNLQLTYNPEGKGTGGVAVKDKDRATLSEILGLTEPKKEAPPFTTEVFSGAGRRIQQFRDGKRVDEYGVEPYSNSSRGTTGANSATGDSVGVDTPPAATAPTQTASSTAVKNIALPVGGFTPLNSSGL
jgi:pilus assembly protein CpaB